MNDDKLSITFTKIHPAIILNDLCLTMHAQIVSHCNKELAFLQDLKISVGKRKWLIDYSVPRTTIALYISLCRYPRVYLLVLVDATSLGFFEARHFVPGEAISTKLNRSKIKIPN